MAKSKEFILERGDKYEISCAWLKYFTGHMALISGLCYRSFVRFFDIKLKPGESKRIRITIEEIIEAKS